MFCAHIKNRIVRNRMKKTKQIRFRTSCKKKTRIKKAQAQIIAIIEFGGAVAPEVEVALCVVWRGRAQSGTSSFAKLDYTTIFAANNLDFNSIAHHFPSIPFHRRAHFPRTTKDINFTYHPRGDTANFLRHVLTACK